MASNCYWDKVETTKLPESLKVSLVWFHFVRKIHEQRTLKSVDVFKTWAVWKQVYLESLEILNAMIFLPSRDVWPFDQIIKGYIQERKRISKFQLSMLHLRRSCSTHSDKVYKMLKKLLNCKSVKCEFNNCLISYHVSSKTFATFHLISWVLLRFQLTEFW